MQRGLLEMAREKLAALARRALVRSAPARVICQVCEQEVPATLADPYGEGDAAVCAWCSGRLQGESRADEPCASSYHEELPFRPGWYGLPLVGYLDAEGQEIDIESARGARYRVAYEIRTCDRCGCEVASRAIF